MRPLHHLVPPALTALALAVALWQVPAQHAQARRAITVASTTSVQNSGLFEFILPRFTAKTGIEVKVVAMGSGQAIKLAERGDADVLFVHDTPSELRFMAAGFGLERREVMYNDFVVIGPASDPARVKGIKDTAAAFKRIAESKTPFVSRGDESGTHKAELRFWKDIGLNVKQAGGSWYRESGQGMGATLNIASAMDGYTLTDRGTWLAFKHRRNLVIVVEGDPKLFNPYGIMLVNPAKWPHVKQAEGMALIEWITSPQGQQAIADFKIGGEPAFFLVYRK
jgi:tungstate transport system substrate-binding protein